MSEPTPPVDPKRSPTLFSGENDQKKAYGSFSDEADKMLCDRCGAEMYRMHAVWRCSACGFKTDCCGW
jgi:ribosomal protein L37E